MAKDLTAKALENFKPGAARREIPDGHTRGLFFVLQPSGAASWALRYRFAGKPKKLTIGPYPAIDLPAARKRASEAVQVVARGEDPAAAKQAAKQAARVEAVPFRDLVELVVETFIERYAAKNSKPLYLAETRRLLRREISAPWKGRRLSSITRADVHALLDAICDRGSPITANRTLAGFRKLCNWSIDRGLIETSPCDKVRAPTAERARDRVLSDDEIKAIWTALESVGWPFGPFGKLLLLTGQRRDEVASMTRSEVDLEARTWTIPKERAKNKHAHVVPLADAALQILEGLPSIGDDIGLVLTTNGKTRISGFSRAKANIDAAIADILGDAPPLERWTYHDLRRTAASGMAGLGIAPHVVEAILNHKSGTIKGVAAVYNRYSYADEKKAALVAWARKLETIVGGKAPANVVELASARVAQ